MYDHIRWDCDDRGVYTLTLHRPAQLNALIPELVDEAVAALAEAASDPGARVVVVTGAGRGFCSGADVGLMDHNLQIEGPDAPWGSDLIRQKVRSRFQPIVRALYECPLPTIASVNGPAVGGGLDMVAACDLAIAGSSARFMVAYTHRGLFPDLGGYWLLPRLIGTRAALELMFTGRSVDAEEAQQLGLVGRVVSDADLEAATDDLAAAIAAGPPIAQRLAKLLVQRTERLELGSALELGAIGVTITETSQDFQDSVAAFVAGRPPTFRGK